MSTPNASNVKIGDVEIWFDAGSDGSEVQLGHTYGGCVLTYEREFEELMVDQYSSPVDYALTSSKLLVECNLAEPTKEYWNIAVPEGNYQTSSTESKLEIGRDTGYLLSQDAGILRLHPRNRAADDREEDWYLYKAVSMEPIETSFKKDEQRLIVIKFVALPDETKTDGNRLGRFGDADIS